MYICKDCGSKYAEKVEYCECGNNIFDYIEDKKTVEAKLPKKSLTIEQKSEILSRLFLIFCIIFSVIIWTIPVKVQEETPKITQNVITKIDKIPSIDKIWDDTPVYPEPQKEDVVINQTPIVLNPIPDYTKPVFKEQKKVEPKTNVTKKEQKPKQEQTKTSQKNIQITPKTTQTNNSQSTKPNTQQSKSNVQQTNVQQSNVQQPKSEPKKVEPQKPKYNPNSPTMLKYKGSLRAAMFSKFPVGSISGSGSCSVKFSIDSTGKLINRSFVKTSDNKSLNDAVYYMMMSVPKFSPPPSEYNGEIIQMNFNINNGEYEISIY